MSKSERFKPHLFYILPGEPRRGCLGLPASQLPELCNGSDSAVLPNLQGSAVTVSDIMEALLLLFWPNSPTTSSREGKACVCLVSPQFLPRTIPVTSRNSINIC